MKSLVVTSVMCVLVGKTLKVMVPFAFKGIVDALSVVSTTTTATTTTATAVAATSAVTTVALPFASIACTLSVAGFLVAYGVSRVTGSFADELKNALFAPVGAAGTTNLGIQTMRKLHSLDLTYHLNREIGVLSKDLDRGSRAFWNFAYMLLFLITPTIFEMGLVGTALYTQGGGQFILIGASAIAMYVVWTVTVTNWRAKFRTRFNTYDSKVSGMVVDSLMNFETVKYFGAESYECDRIEREMRKMNHQLKLLDQSVALLNMGQQLIFAAAAVGSLYLASCGVLAGTMTVGHLVLVDGLLIQLYMPLSYLGMIYRDVQTSTQNMQAMLSIMDAECEVKDHPDARPYAYKDGTIEFRNVNFEYMMMVNTPPKGLSSSSSTSTTSIPRRGDGAKDALSPSSSPLRNGKVEKKAVAIENEVEKKNESAEEEPTTTLSSSSSSSSTTTSSSTAPPPSTSPNEAAPTNEMSAEKESATTSSSTATRSDSVEEEGNGALQLPSLSVKKRLGVLHKVDFTIPGGSVVAFVGASGSGKSTIFRLLFRFFNPSHGTILLDGQPLQELQIQSVRQHIGVIPQDPILFNNSIKYNVSYSRSTPTSVEEVMRAAKGACLHDTVMGFPEGYFTGVGERGCRLSGGEKQRVAIARALLDDKPILLADEATSALDIETEKGVMQALKEQRGGSGGRRRTLLLIAHRLTTVKDADIIFVLRDGAVAEFGDHDTLLKNNGIYSQLWLRQLEEKEVKESKEGKASSPTTP